MIKYASPGFRAQFSQLDGGERFYIDPRGIDYPPIGGTATYYQHTQAYNAPGSYGLSSAMTYLFSPSSSFTIDVLVRPNHQSDTASNIIRLLGGDTITLAYNTSGYYRLIDRSSNTADGGIYGFPWKRLTMVFTYGGTMYLYVDGSLADSASAASLALNSVMLEVNGSANSIVNHVRIFNGYAADATAVANNFKDVRYEEIFFGFNKNAIGRTRCNITSVGGINRVTDLAISQGKGYKASRASFSVNNQSGEFNDDIYGTYTPQSGIYNGTVAQKYLTRRMRAEIEVWSSVTPLYPDTDLYPSTTLYPQGNEYYEPLFIGYIPPGSFVRSTEPLGISSIALSANGYKDEIDRRIIRKSRTYENYLLSDSSGSSSLFHSIAGLGTYREVYNYCGNSCFENTTIGNSWDVAGGTFSRSSASPLLGTYCGVLSGTNPRFWQYILFPSLSAGETFSYDIYCNSTSAITGEIIIYEYQGTTANDSTVIDFTHSGKGWDKLSVSHTISNSSSDRLRAHVLVDGTVSNIYFDCAMLKYGNPMPYVFANNTDGTSGVMAIGSEQLGSYEFIGIDADTVNYTHPWAVVNKDESVGKVLDRLADACLARVMYITNDGILIMRSAFTSALPSSIGSIDSPTLVSSGTQSPTANKIKVAGVHIDKKESLECVWQIEASGLQSSNASSSTQWYRDLANGDTLPMAVYDGKNELECVYSNQQTERGSGGLIATGNIPGASK